MEPMIKTAAENAKTTITALYELCDKMDEITGGVSKWMPDKTSREMQHLSFLSYFLYIDTADGLISEEDAEFINLTLDLQYSVQEYEHLAQKSKADDDTTMLTVPVVLRAMVDFENQIGQQGKLIPLYYDLHAFLGILCMFGDMHAKQSEYDRIQKYLQMIYAYLEANLDESYDLETPPMKMMSMLQSIVKVDKDSQQAIIEPDTDNAKKKEQPKKEGSQEEEKTLEELMSELYSLIGLEEVKYDVISLINLIRIRDIREQMGYEMPPISQHLVFSGNPGTGKTTVARLLARIYHKIGILSKGQLVEVDRSGLVAGYVGQTALKVKDVLESAKGGVLFIDEAYALTPENAGNDYGLEAIDTLVKGMEDFRDDLIVIVAGYTKPMERFIASNPGLKSRFNKFIEFPDYTAEELTRIFQRFCTQNKYRASKPALQYVFDHFTARLAEKPENFANAREARNLFEFAVARQANRIIIESNPTEDLITLLRMEDVAGKNMDMGRQQFLAESAMAELEGKRAGIPNSQLPMRMDEFEITPKCWHALQKAGIRTVGEVLDYLDSGKELTEINNISQKNAQEIVAGLKSLGWV